jgi:hypothetical protein
MQQNASKCLFCDEPIAGERIKVYKGLDCNQWWNFWPLDVKCLHKKKWAMTKRYLCSIGWFYNNGIRRKNANDWQTKEL